ncbi:MAG TPA: hypothetical protein PLJ27_20770, partial [Polyangiaceae bacterium]|nr:hypothetical protein [Polyangiaceae bacterium]
SGTIGSGDVVTVSGVRLADVRLGQWSLPLGLGPAPLSAPGHVSVAGHGDCSAAKNDHRQGETSDRDRRMDGVCCKRRGLFQGRGRV